MVSGGVLLVSVVAAEKTQRGCARMGSYDVSWVPERYGRAEVLPALRREAGQRNGVCERDMAVASCRVRPVVDVAASVLRRLAAVVALKRKTHMQVGGGADTVGIDSTEASEDCGRRLRSRSKRTMSLVNPQPVIILLRCRIVLVIMAAGAVDGEVEEGF
jgi:hypothetical protein